MRQIATASVTATAALLLAVPSAHAGGIEYTGQGAMSLQRGGAVAARAEDPMVLAHNPAGLVELRGSQFLLNVNAAFFDACFDPIGFYGWGTYLGGDPSEFPDPDGGESEVLLLGEVIDGGAGPGVDEYYYDPLDTVCLEQNIVPIPQMAWTMRVSEDFGIGFGLIFPAAQPAGQWGGELGIIRGDDGDLRPAPSRYMALKSATLGVFPTLGFGYRFSDMFRAGLSFEWGIIAANVFTMAGSVGGTTPANDVLAHVKAQDYFIPALTASLHVVPTDNIDVVLGFRWQDDVDAKGDVDITTGLFNPANRPTTTSNIPITSLKQPMPWRARLGLRYADRFAPRPAGTGDNEPDPASPEVIHDPLQDERWDVELDLEYQANGDVDEQSVHYALNNELVFRPLDPMAAPSTIIFPNESVPETVIKKHWEDQVSVRLGGTYNVLPGKFGVSAGAHYENRGIDPAFMQLDFWPLSRVGLHTGVIFRLAKRIDLVFSYAHIFQETITVSPPFHEDRTVIGPARMANNGQAENIDKRVGVWLDRGNPPGGTEILFEEPPTDADAQARLEQNVSQSPLEQPPYIVNSGTYRSNFDVLAVGLNVHF